MYNINEVNHGKSGWKSEGHAQHCAAVAGRILERAGGIGQPEEAEHGRVNGGHDRSEWGAYVQRDRQIPGARK